MNINPPLAGNFNVTSTGVYFMSPEKRPALDVRGISRCERHNGQGIEHDRLRNALISHQQ